MTNIRSNEREFTLTNNDGAEFTIEIAADGIVEVGVDNGQNYDDNQYAYTSLNSEDSIDFLTALQIWIKSLVK